LNLELKSIKAADLKAGRDETQPEGCGYPGSFNIPPQEGDSMKKMFAEFREFAMRGNVMDMAVGIIIGAAFGKIVSTFVANVLMPPLGLLLGRVNFSELAIVLKRAADGSPAVSMQYGLFIQALVDFVIIAFAIFMVVKGMNSFHKKQEAAPAAPPAPTAQETLLTEIRDLLKHK
jgi:large conductance mechanosensitive channel